MVMDRITNTVAAGAVASPWWLPKLSEVSQVAGHLIPILGVIWLVVQLLHRAANWKKKD